MEKEREPYKVIGAGRPCHKCSKKGKDPILCQRRAYPAGSTPTFVEREYNFTIRTEVDFCFRCQTSYATLPIPKRL